MLSNRGFEDPIRIKSFLESNYKKGFHNPFLMKDMDKAVDRIKTAIANGEKIMIFGDYDVDGISGTAILMHTLRLLGARVSYRLPHRVEDGYGLSEKFVEDFAKLGVAVTITVDCGISCKNQVALAADKGIDVIISDHHTIPDAFPDRAYAILHPLQPGCDYPFTGLTGAGVAFKLACALLTDKFSGEEREKYLYSILDLASLGTVADLGPLVDENRIIVKYGLEALQHTKWYGLKYLKEYAGVEENVKLDISVIGFRLGPRINAAGRIDHPYYALQLLLYNQPDEKAKLLAEHLDKLNLRRQKMVADALEELEDHFIQNHKSDKIYIAWSPDWHVGILGLLASKIVEKHARPCIVLQDFGDYMVASARSPEGFNMVEALNNHRDYLEHYGGHAQAAGFNIKKDRIDAFTEAMTRYAEEKLHAAEDKQDLNIDCELREDDINENLLSFLEQMEPYGIGNEQPRFLIRNLYPDYIKKVGKTGQHLHFRVQGAKRQYSVIGFKLGEFEPFLREHQKIDLVCYLGKNTFRGNTQLQFRCVDFKKAE
jgi:single-stranded-DNA-specific exonuclease